MSLLLWPTRKNIAKLIQAFDELEESNPHYIRPINLAMALKISQRKAKFILEAAERADALTSFYRVTCPNCNSPYDQYEYFEDIPKVTEHCDLCHAEEQEILDRNIEKVYKINEQK